MLIELKQMQNKGKQSILSPPPPSNLKGGPGVQVVYNTEGWPRSELKDQTLTFTTPTGQKCHNSSSKLPWIGLRALSTTDVIKNF